MAFTPALFYKDPMAALAWLEKAFGFETTMLIEPPADDPTMMHDESGETLHRNSWLSARSAADSR